MKQRDTVFVLASSAIVVILWIVFSVISKYTSPTVNDVVLSSVTPIEKTFDLATLDQIKKRQKVEPLFTAQQPVVSITPTISPNPRLISPTTSPTPTTSLTPTLSPTTTATPSGI